MMNCSYDAFNKSESYSPRKPKLAAPSFCPSRLSTLSITTSAEASAASQRFLFRKDGRALIVKAVVFCVCSRAVTPSRMLPH